MAAAINIQSTSSLVPQDVTDFTKILRQGTQAVRDTPRTHAKYRETVDGLRNVIVTVRFRIPPGTVECPAGVSEDAWNQLMDTLFSAEDVLDKELRTVKRDEPGAHKERKESRKERRAQRKKDRKARKNLHGKAKREQRKKDRAARQKKFKEEQAKRLIAHKKARQEKRIARKEKRETRKAARRGGQAPAQPVQAEQLAPEGTTTVPVAAGGVVDWLWPIDKPIYARPGAIAGALAVAGVFGWVLFGGEKPKPAAQKPAAS